MHSNLTYKLLLDREEVYDLWCDFGDAIGIDLLRDIYGPYWPRKQVSGEWVFEWFNDKKLIGWTAIRHDILEPIMWANIGIFPDSQNMKYSREIFDETLSIGFRVFFDVEWVFVSISKKNPQYFDHMKNNACRWELAGEINVPQPGYTIFALERGKFNVEKNAQ